MTKSERRVVAQAYGAEAPTRGRGKYSIPNQVVRVFGGMENIERSQDNLPINGSSEGIIFSRAFRPARRNGYDGRPAKPNRAHRVR